MSLFLLYEIQLFKIIIIIICKENIKGEYNL